MSSRHIRRLTAIKEKTQDGNEDGKEDHEDHDDEQCAQQNTKFQGLEIGSDSEPDKPVLGDSSPSTSATAGPSGGLQQFRSANVPEEDKYGAKKKTYTQAELAKKEKMARRKLKKNKQCHGQKEDEDEDWFSDQTRFRSGIQPQRAEEMVVDRKEQRRNQLFYANPHHLDVNNELAKVYGNKDKKSPTPLHRRASHWIGVSPEIQSVRIKGIVMSRYKTDERVKYFRFTHSQEYRSRVHDLIKDVKARLNDQGHHESLLHSITCVEACLENSDILYSFEEHSEGRLALEQCLFCMQFVADPSFSFVDGNTRLLYDFVENRPFLIALLKYIYILSNSACYITALALAKVLINLDPSDPLCLIFIIDTLAIRAREFKWLVCLVDAWREPRKANHLFNMRYSRALALFYIARRAKEGEAEANAALSKAIISYPSVVLKIIDYAQISVPDDIKNHAIFKASAKYPLPSSDLQQLIELYAWLIAPRWREPFIIEWLVKVLRDTITQYDESSELRKHVSEAARLVVRLYKKIPRELNRHLAAIRSMSSYIANIPPLPATVAFNPYPNEGLAIDTYDYFTNFSQEEQPHGSIIRSFIEGIAPAFDRFGPTFLLPCEFLFESGAVIRVDSQGFINIIDLLFGINKNFASGSSPNIHLLPGELAESLHSMISSEVVYSDDRYEVHLLRGPSMSSAEEVRNAVHDGSGLPPQIFEMEEVQIRYRSIREIEDYLKDAFISDDEMVLPMLVSKVIVIYLIVGMIMMYNIIAGEYIPDTRNARKYILLPLD